MMSTIHQEGGCVHTCSTLAVQYAQLVLGRGQVVRPRVTQGDYLATDDIPGTKALMDLDLVHFSSTHILFPTVGGWVSEWTSLW